MGRCYFLWGALQLSPTYLKETTGPSLLPCGVGEGNGYITGFSVDFVVQIYSVSQYCIMGFTGLKLVFSE